MRDATCSVEGCEKLAHCRSLCPMHYQRWRTRGETGSAHEERRANGERVGRKIIPRQCAVEGCDQPSRKHGWCASHYAQWKRTGEITPWKWRWGDGGYISTHAWLKRTEGHPSSFPCVGCGRGASEWSFNYTTDDYRIDPRRGSPFVRDAEHYSPRCTPCHRAFDAMQRKLDPWVGRKVGD